MRWLGGARGADSVGPMEVGFDGRHPAHARGAVPNTASYFSQQAAHSAAVGAQSVSLPLRRESAGGRFLCPEPEVFESTGSWSLPSAHRLSYGARAMKGYLSPKVGSTVRVRPYGVKVGGWVIVEGCRCC